MKLIEIKKKIEEELKEKFFIVNQTIIDKNKNISIKIENNEIQNYILQIKNINENKNEITSIIPGKDNNGMLS